MDTLRPTHERTTDRATNRVRTTRINPTRVYRDPEQFGPQRITEQNGEFYDGQGRPLARSAVDPRILVHSEAHPIQVAEQENVDIAARCELCGLALNASQKAAHLLEHYRDLETQQAPEPEPEPPPSRRGRSAA